LGDPGIDGRIIRWIFRKWHVGARIESSWFRIGTGGGQLKTSYLLKKDCAAWSD
jgi:hypothetical protein